MFSFGWSEIALTFIVVVIIVGPKEIPNLLKQLGSFSKSLKKISRDFKNSLNEIADETEIKDIKNTISDVNNIKENIKTKNIIKDEIDSIKESSNIFEDQINKVKTTDQSESKNIKKNETKKSET